MNRNGKSFKIAVPEKAVLDYFYINPAMKTEGDFISMRINKDIFLELIDEKKLKTFMRKIGNASLGKRMRNFLEFIKNA